MVQVYKVSTPKGEWIAVRIPRDEVLIERIRSVMGRRWSPKLKSWLLPYTVVSWNQFRRRFQHYRMEEERRIDFSPFVEFKKEIVLNKVVKPEVIPPHEEELVRLEERLRLRRYSWQTVKTYMSFFRDYLFFLEEKHPEQGGDEEIKAYMLLGIKEKGWKERPQNQAIYGLKFYY